MSSAASQAGGGSGRPIAVGDILRYPSGTTLHFVLLSALLLLSGVFVGNWLYLATAPAVQRNPYPPWPWLFIPPLAVLALAVAVALVMPRMKEHRRHLVPLPGDQSPVAAARYDHLVAESGLHRAPVITWNPRDAGSDALAYGRPGRYRIAVAPAVLSSARRHPAAFDTIIRHELGHVRNHDVLITYFAVSSWYALLPALAAPLLLHIAVSDFSLVPDYLARAVVLSVLVYLSRAALLRAREYYADIRAVSWSHDATTFSALLAAVPAQKRFHSLRRWWALHPARADRVLTVRDPSRLGRPQALQLLAVGFTAGAAMPLFRDLVASIPGIALVDADYVARSLVFAVAGGFVGVVLVRAEAAGKITAGLSGLLAVLLALGVSAGLVLSLAETGVPDLAGGNLAGNVILSLLCGALVVVGADTLRMLASKPGGRLALVRSAGVSVLTAAAFALAADSSLTVTVMLRDVPRLLLSEMVPFILANGGWASALAVLAAVVAGAGAVTRRGARKRVVFQILLGCAAGILAAICATAIRWEAGTFASDEAVWHYYLASLWFIAAGAAVAGLASTLSDRAARTAAGILTAAFAIVLGCVTFALLNWIAGDPADPAGAASMAGLSTAITVTIGLPLMALASIAAGFFRHARAPGSDTGIIPAER